MYEIGRMPSKMPVFRNKANCWKEVMSDSSGARAPRYPRGRNSHSVLLIMQNTDSAVAIRRPEKRTHDLFELPVCWSSPAMATGLLPEDLNLTSQDISLSDIEGGEQPQGSPFCLCLILCRFRKNS